MRKAILAVSALLFASAFLLLASCTAPDFSKDLEEGAPTASRWLSALPDATELTALSIPGAHDAASCTITDFPLWTRTQVLTVAQLWNCGVRVFDLRPAYKDGELGIYHDKYGAGVTYAQVLSTVLDALERDSGEFALFLIRHEREADDNAPEWADALAACHFAAAEHIVPYKEGLMLGDLRGKLMVLVRTDESGPAAALGRIEGWSSARELGSQQGARIVDSAGQEHPLWVQDWYDPDDADSKWLAVKEMLDAAAVAKPRPIVINHASGYIGSLPDYRAVAKVVNPQLAEYLQSFGGPAGIVMLDFAGAATSLATAVRGDAAVRAIIGNN
jgi:hypothetical protein